MKPLETMGCVDGNKMKQSVSVFEMPFAPVDKVVFRKAAGF